MDILIRYGFSIEEIKNMIDSNPDINNVDDSVIYTLIDVLGYCGCLSNHIKNIFILLNLTRPFFLLMFSLSIFPTYSIKKEI